MTLRVGLPDDAKGLKILGEDGIWTPAIGNQQVENLVTNPSFEAVQPGSTVLRTNLAENPNAEVNIAGWYSNSSAIGSVSRDTSSPISGTASVMNTGTGTNYQSASLWISAQTVAGTGALKVKPGDPIQFSVDVRCEQPNRDVRIYHGFRNASGTTILSVADNVITPLEPNVVRRVSTKSITPEGADSVLLVIVIQTRDGSVSLPGERSWFDNLLIENTLQARDYFDGNSVDSLGWDYGWTGTANASTSTAKATSVEVHRNIFTNPNMVTQNGTVVARKNMIVNPSFEVDTRGWGNNTPNFTNARDTTIFRSGVASVKVTCVTESAGDINTYGSLSVVDAHATYTASAYIYLPSGTSSMRISIDFRDSAGASLNPSTIVINEQSIPANTWTRISVTAKAPADATRAFVRVGTTGTAIPAGWVYHVDDVLFEMDNTVRDYFDATMPASGDFTYAWEGVAHYSQSYMTAPGVMGISSATGRYSRAYQSKVWANSGTTSLAIRPNGHQDSFATFFTYPFAQNKTYTVMGVVNIPKQLSGTLDGRKLSITVIYDNKLLTPTYLKPQIPETATGVHEYRATITTPDVAPGNAFARLYNGSANSDEIVYWDNVMIVEGVYNGPYFDGSSPSMSDFSHSWVGTVDNSASVRRGTRINPYVGGAAAAILSNEWSSTGSASLRIISKYPARGSSYVSLAHYNNWSNGLVAGKTYTAKVKCRVDEEFTGVTRSIAFLDYSTGGSHVSATAPTTVGVHDLSITFTVPTSGYWYLRLYNAVAQGEPDAWFDDLAIIEGTYTGDYFDGNNPPDINYIYRWSGEPHASTSIGN